MTQTEHSTRDAVMSQNIPGTIVTLLELSTTLARTR